MSKYFVIIEGDDLTDLHIEELEPVEQLTDCMLAFKDAIGNRIEAIKGVSCFTSYDKVLEQVVNDLAESAKQEVLATLIHSSTLKANADCYDANWSDGYTIEESVFSEVAENSWNLSTVGYVMTRLLRDAAKHYREEMD